MKTILYMAISINGKITGKGDDTSWVDDADVERMDTLMEECGAMIMGRKTYESFGDDLPTDSAHQIVVTRNKELLGKKQDNVTFTNSSLPQILQDLESRGFDKVLLAGGGELNTSMIKEDLVDEIRLIVKPVVMGEGKDLFNDFKGSSNFTCQSVRQLPNGATEIIFTR